MEHLPSPPPAFTNKKSKILAQLAVPTSEYTDLSPKGSVDEAIRDLIDELNALDGFVTTSSCAGRISVFLEGHKAAPGEGGVATATAASDLPRRQQTQARAGGKGGGGAWLFVSHDPVDMTELRDEGAVLRCLGMSSRDDGGPGDMDDMSSKRLIHFKFEPMILHVLTSSASHAQLLLKCALQAGFRESGALNIAAHNDEPATPMVAVRTMGLSLESLVGYEEDGVEYPIVTESYLRGILAIANERFVENAKRIQRFRQAIRDALNRPAARIGENGADWEDAAARRERKRIEGLRRKAEVAALGRERTRDGGEDDGPTGLAIDNEEDAVA